MNALKNTKNKISNTAAMALLLTLYSGLSEAAILEGHFQRDNFHAFVKVANGDAYGMTWVDDDKVGMISFYKIDEQDDGTQAWIRLKVGESKILSTAEGSVADYNASVIERGTSYLSLNPTESGRKDGLTRIILKVSSAYSWLELPEQPLSYVTDGDSRVSRRSNTFSRQQVQGAFKVYDQGYSGDFYVRAPIPASLFGTLHSSDLNSENESGRQMSDDILSFIVRIKHNRSEAIAFFKLTFVGEMKVYKIIKP